MLQPLRDMPPHKTHTLQREEPLVLTKSGRWCQVSGEWGYDEEKKLLKLTLEQGDDDDDDDDDKSDDEGASPTPA
jgi:hypothetical protein